jgi:hypothetical protein
MSKSKMREIGISKDSKEGMPKDIPDSRTPPNFQGIDESRPSSKGQLRYQDLKNTIN